jgi:hypothetical protein
MQPAGWTPIMLTWKNDGQYNLRINFFPLYVEKSYKQIQEKRIFPVRNVLHITMHHDFFRNLGA